MHLLTLGRVALEGSDFGRPKPLLLLAYLALEGPKSRRQVAELLWGDAAKPMNSLRVALSQLRRGAPGALREEGSHLSCAVGVDAALMLSALEAGDAKRAASIHRGPFLDGLDLAGLGLELEEWVYSTREYLAERLRGSLLRRAEADAALGDFRAAGANALQALDQAAAPPLEPAELERMHRLLVAAGSERAVELRMAARDYGLHLEADREAARSQLWSDSGRAASRNNLPVSLTEFVGRDLEQVELSRLLDAPGCRLVTIVGFGGVGKSRLALQVAHDKVREGAFPDGVYFVALESLGDAAAAPAAILGAMGAPPSSASSPFDELRQLLRSKRLLLVLDNCEHLSALSPIVAALLAECPGLKALATSRASLRTPGEQLFPLEGLLGTEGEADHDAVRLFLGQARRVRPGYEPEAAELADIRAICRQVHGFPLAIELAAARLRLMSPREMRRELEQGLGLLERGGDTVTPRHAGLRATFDYSWRLLDADERAVLARLSVFSGGFSREAASRVAGATIPLLASLLDKSLLTCDDSGRFGRHPLVHQFTTEKLAEDTAEWNTARDEHAIWFTRLAEEAAAEGGSEQRDHFARLEREMANLRTALEWTLTDASAGGDGAAVGVEGRSGAGERREEAARERTLLGVRLAVALYRFWYYRSHLSEGREWLTLAVERSSSLGDSARSLHSKALHAAGVLAEEQGAADEAERLFRDRLSLAREEGDQLGQAAALNSLAVLALGRREHGRAKRLLEESIELRRRLGRKELQLGPHLNLGLIALAEEDLDRAQGEFERALALAEELGNEMVTATAYTNLGAVFVDRREAGRAEGAFREAVKHFRSLGNRDGLAYCLDGVAAVATLRGQYPSAARLAGAAASLRRSLGAAATAGDVLVGERRLAAAREALGDGFDSAWREGYEADAEEMLDEALEPASARAKGTRDGE